MLDSEEVIKISEVSLLRSISLHPVALSDLLDRLQLIFISSHSLSYDTNAGKYF